MRTLLKLLPYFVALNVFAQAPIIRGPGTTNQPAAWTNAVRNAVVIPVKGVGAGTNIITVTNGGVVTVHGTGSGNSVTDAVTNQWRIDSTNIAHATFSSIAAMVADVTVPMNGEVTVRSYYGTNDSNGRAWGGGKFIRQSTSETADLGTVFAHASSGQWKRVRDNNTLWKGEWYGMWPIESDATLHSSSRALTNMIAKIKENSGAVPTIVFPPFLTAYTFTTGGTNCIEIADVQGWTLKGDTETHGVPLSFPYDAPVLAFLGNSMSNGCILNLRGLNHKVVGLGFLRDTPSNGIHTNHCDVAIEHDQIAGYTYITSDTLFENLRIQTFQEVDTNGVGIYISRTAHENCENIRFKKILVAGANNDHSLCGIGIVIGDNANALSLVFDEDCTFAHVRKQIYAINGSYRIRGGLGTGALISYDLSGGSDPVTLEGVRNEHDWMFANMGVPIARLTDNFIATDSDASHAGTNGAVNLHSGYYLFENNLWQPDATGTSKHLSVASGTSPTATFINNDFGTSSVSNTLPLMAQGVAFNNKNQPGRANMILWQRASGGVDLIDTFDSDYLTNRPLISLPYRKTLQLSRTDANVVIGAQAPDTDSTDNLRLRSPGTTSSVKWGDASLSDRFTFYADSPAVTVAQVRSTNRAILEVTADASPGVGGSIQMNVEQAHSDIKYGTTGLNIRDSFNNEFIVFEPGRGVASITGTNTMTITAPQLNLTTPLVLQVYPGRARYVVESGTYGLHLDANAGSSHNKLLYEGGEFRLSSDIGFDPFKASQYGGVTSMSSTGEVTAALSSITFTGHVAATSINLAGGTNLPVNGMIISANKLAGSTNASLAPAGPISIGAGLILTNGVLATTQEGGVASNSIDVASSPSITWDTNANLRTASLTTEVTNKWLADINAASNVLFGIAITNPPSGGDALTNHETRSPFLDAGLTLTNSTATLQVGNSSAADPVIQLTASSAGSLRMQKFDASTMEIFETGGSILQLRGPTINLSGSSGITMNGAGNFTFGVDAGSAATQVFQFGNSSSSDTAGGNFKIQTSYGKGTGGSGEIEIWTGGTNPASSGAQTVMTNNFNFRRNGDFQAGGTVVGTNGFSSDGSPSAKLLEEQSGTRIRLPLTNGAGFIDVFGSTNTGAALLYARGSGPSRTLSFAEIAAINAALDWLTNNSGGSSDPRFTSSTGKIISGSNWFAAPILASSTNFVDRVEATNSSTLDLIGGGSTLAIGSGGATLSGAGAGFIGVGANLTGIRTNSIDSTFIDWVNSKSGSGNFDTNANYNLSGDFTNTGAWYFLGPFYADVFSTGTFYTGQTNKTSLAADGDGKLIQGPFTGSSGTILVLSNAFNAQIVNSGTNYTDRVEATNSSTLTLSGGGSTLSIGSGGATLSGAGAGFIGVGANLTGIRTQSIDATFYGWVDSKGSGGGGDSITNGRTLYVATNGNNSTAIRGKPAFPWADPSVAAFAMLPGDHLSVAPGYYLLSTNIWLTNSPQITLEGFCRFTYTNEDTYGMFPDFGTEAWAASVYAPHGAEFICSNGAPVVNITANQNNKNFAMIGGARIDMFSSEEVVLHYLGTNVFRNCSMTSSNGTTYYKTGGSVELDHCDLITYSTSNDDTFLNDGQLIVFRNSTLLATGTDCYGHDGGRFEFYNTRFESRAGATFTIRTGGSGLMEGCVGLNTVAAQTCLYVNDTISVTNIGCIFKATGAGGRAVDSHASGTKLYFSACTVSSPSDGYDFYNSSGNAYVSATPYDPTKAFAVTRLDSHFPTTATFGGVTWFSNNIVLSGGSFNMQTAAGKLDSTGNLTVNTATTTNLGTGLQVNGNAKVNQTNYVDEGWFTNGVTLGGVRRTTWPTSGSGGGTNVFFEAGGPDTTYLRLGTEMSGVLSIASNLFGSTFVQYTNGSMLWSNQTHAVTDTYLKINPHYDAGGGVFSMAIESYFEGSAAHIYQDSANGSWHIGGERLTIDGGAVVTELSGSGDQWLYVNNVGRLTIGGSLSSLTLDTEFTSPMSTVTNNGSGTITAKMFNGTAGAQTTNTYGILAAPGGDTKILVRSTSGDEAVDVIVADQRFTFTSTGLPGSAIGSGTVADARIASTITRDTELTAPMGYATQNLAAVSFNNNAAAVTNLPIVTSVCIPMGAWFSNAISATTFTPASSIVISNYGDAFEFSDAVTNCIRSRFALPWDWNAGTVQVELTSVSRFTNGLLATNTVFAVRAAAIPTGAIEDNPTWGTGVWLTNKIDFRGGTGTNQISYKTISSAITVGNTPTSAKSILWEIQRLGAATGDTSTNLTSIIDFRVYYQKNTRTDFPVATP